MEEKKKKTAEKLVQPLWKTVWRLKKNPKKLKIEFPCDSAISLLGKYPEEILIQKDSSTIYNSQDIEAT